MIDLGNRFSREADHLGTLLQDRDACNAKRIPFGVGFLDDCLGGLYPADLVLFGAATGVGKTALAVSIAWSAAKLGVDPVYLFALEARVGEVSARIGFQEIAKRTTRKLDFSAWWRGRYQDVDAQHWEAVAEEIREPMSRIRTLYKRRGDFTNNDLAKQLEAISTDAKLVLLDHVHVVDSERDSELSTQHKTVRLLRDLALDRGIPVVAVSHLRKKQGNERTLMPETDDLHGSSNLSKIATGVVLVARDWESEAGPHLSPTFMQVSKDRNGRAGPLIARTVYDKSSGLYQLEYRLGRIGWEERKQVWMPVPEPPYWAEHDSGLLRPF